VIVNYEGFLGWGDTSLVSDKNLYRNAEEENPVLLGEGQPISHDNNFGNIYTPEIGNQSDLGNGPQPMPAEVGDKIGQNQQEPIDHFTDGPLQGSTPFSMTEEQRYAIERMRETAPSSLIDVPRFDVTWIGDWTKDQKTKITNSLQLIRSNIGILRQEITNTQLKLSPSDDAIIKEAMVEYMHLLNRIQSALDGNDYIRITQKSFGNFSEADGKYYFLRGNISLNTNREYNWEKKSQEELAQLLFHELSHQYGTVDDNSKGPLMNAHNIDDRLYNAIMGYELDLPKSLIIQDMLTSPRK
jgi:hypothetical protein